MRFIGRPLLVPLLGFGALCFALLATWSQMPQRVASHFDIHGKPDGWATREEYLVTLLSLAAITIAIVLGIFLMVKLTVFAHEKSEAGKPQNGKDTARALWRLGCEVGGGVCLFLAGTHLMVVRANASSEPRLGFGIYILAGIFLTLIALRARALLSGAGAGAR